MCVYLNIKKNIFLTFFNTLNIFRPDLVRPANSLYMHNLTGLLEAAIRATNAQFDDSETLKRLDCRLLEVG